MPLVEFLSGPSALFTQYWTLARSAMKARSFSYAWLWETGPSGTTSMGARGLPSRGVNRSCKGVKVASDGILDYTPYNLLGDPRKVAPTRRQEFLATFHYAPCFDFRHFLCRFVVSNLTSSIGLDQIAMELGIHPTHLCKVLSKGRQSR